MNEIIQTQPVSDLWIEFSLNCMIFFGIMCILQFIGSKLFAFSGSLTDRQKQIKILYYWNSINIALLINAFIVYRYCYNRVKDVQGPAGPIGKQGIEGLPGPTGI